MTPAGKGRRAPLVVATDAAGAGGGLAEAAALAVAAAQRDRSAGVLMVEATGEERRRRPTLLASEAARDLEAALGDALAALPGAAAAARGNLCWLTVPSSSGDVVGRLAELLDTPLPCLLVVAHLPASQFSRALDVSGLEPVGALIRADLGADRELVALAVAELHARGMRARVAKRSPGTVATRRAVAGLDPGGEASRRAARAARALLGWKEGLPIAAEPGERGQALPLVLGAVAAVVLAALALAAIGGAVTGKGRVQRAADLAALSAARSMRDDVDRLLAPARLPNGDPNPVHLSKEQYLVRAVTAAKEAAAANGVAGRRLRVRFPDAETFAPVQAKARVLAEVDLTRRPRRVPLPVAASAIAEASAPTSFGGMSAMATGGGYSGPLAYRQGRPMRPDVAAAFDDLAAAARRAGVALTINSAFRSDAEQAQLFAQNPDPTWVAPPGKSLHRCATELDLGPPSAYAWLAANAPRFGFLKRYSWEPWHFGFTRGPAPCSAAGDAVSSSGVSSSSSDQSASAGADGRAAGTGGLPAYVPAQYRAAIQQAAARWNVSAALLAAQLMAESNFNPTAVSPAGARGIAQFMPATAAAYGLTDPFNAAAAIDAQAHLMSDLLKQFRSIPLALAAYNAGPGAVEACGCASPYAETQAYVTRILALLDGAGEILAPELEVRLVG